jgi:NADH-quinone oxidoreductase subunit F
MQPFLLPEHPVTTLEGYRGRGGTAGLARARDIGPRQTVQELRLARLRGRGGGGFPTGIKWATVLDADAGTRYVVCNAAEGEPGTFKDRTIIRTDPFQVVEGIAIAGFTMAAPRAFIAVKASFERERAALAGAIAEMEDAGLLDGLAVEVVSGPGEYLFGEEKAMLEVIEGRDPLPRLLPPYEHGLFATDAQLGWEPHAPVSRPDERGANPTLVNNCETLANVPHILAKGAEWFRSMGTVASAGSLVCTAVGDVRRAVVVELEMGTPLAELVERAGGPPSGRRHKAAFSGVANPVVLPRQFATPLTYEHMRAIGSALGSAGFIFYDDSTCMAEVARVFSRFLYVESCGQCPACKLGSERITDALDAIEEGRGGDDSIDAVASALRTVTDGNRCYLAVEEQTVIASILATFPEEITEQIEAGCRRPRGLVPPVIVDIADGVPTFDERQARKQPDWTYRDGP